MCDTIEIYHIGVVVIARGMRTSEHTQMVPKWLPTMNLETECAEKLHKNYDAVLKNGVDLYANQGERLSLDGPLFCFIKKWPVLTPPGWYLYKSFPRRSWNTWKK